MGSPHIPSFLKSILQRLNIMQERKHSVVYQAPLNLKAALWAQRDLNSLVIPKEKQIIKSAAELLEIPEETETRGPLINSTGFEAWLPFAAKAYELSSDPNDYIFRPIPAIISDYPNRNGVGFPASELARWSTDGGCQAYRTWIGKPMHSEHGNWHPDPNNPDPTKAIGVIVDVAMTPLTGFADNKLWKVLMLGAIDRTKDVKRAKRIEDGKLNTYSMGALVGYYRCSYCNEVVGKRCNHIDPDDPVVLYKIRNTLVYRQCYEVFGTELSSVEDPAYGIATSDEDHLSY